jgi:hypothetical protein
MVAQEMLAGTAAAGVNLTVLVGQHITHLFVTQADGTTQLVQQSTGRAPGHLCAWSSADGRWGEVCDSRATGPLLEFVELSVPLSVARGRRRRAGSSSPPACCCQVQRRGA